MNLSDFQNLRQRVSRVHDAMKKNEGEGFTQSLNTHTDEKLVVRGIKSPEYLEDQILTLCIWMWSMKDYLKKLAIDNGCTGRQIEDIVNNNDSLAIIADIANRTKHGTLTKTRCGDFAKLSGVGYKIKHTSLNTIEFGKLEVTLDVGKPEEAELTATIEFDSGNRAMIDDAFAVISDAMSVWESQAFPLIGA